ncbi:hypothetical protein GW742_17990 [Citrobacter freundii]|nr:hypothetical protein [Citrobacter freundii]MBC6508322.1 hypothetical protein [Citrobacter freundii]
MVSEHMAKNISAAMKAREWLWERGSYVTREIEFMGGFMLEVSTPPLELVDKAQRINENSNGATRSVWVATIEDCRVIWR